MPKQRYAQIRTHYSKYKNITFSSADKKIRGFYVIKKSKNCPTLYLLIHIATRSCQMKEPRMESNNIPFEALSLNAAQSDLRQHVTQKTCPIKRNTVLLRSIIESIDNDSVRTIAISLDCHSTLVERCLRHAKTILIDHKERAKE